ncbi:hypothetical protein ACUDTL_16845 [Stenotrophomonas pavanii]|uniref:hypothetical protein n=1 Tax=Stenotrophomonas pavanii TaxID=487698 RepID=UPI00404263A7
MAGRSSRQQITRRTAVAARTSEWPSLAVQADQSVARGAGALSGTAAAVLGRVANMAGRQAALGAQTKAVEDTTAGQAARMEEDLSGAPRQAAEALAAQSEPFRRGYLKADGALRIRDWQLDASKELAKAEPGSDIEPMLRAKMGELLANPEFQDAQVRKALLPAVARATDAIRLKWTEDSVKETFARQEEALTVIAREGMKDGSLLADGGMKMLYDNLNTEEYAYLNRDDVDSIVARAAVDLLASGERNPAEIVSFFEQPREDGTPGLMNSPKFQDELQRAAGAGAAVIKKREDEARDQAMAQAEWTLQDLADKGRLTHGAIDGYAAKFGLSGGDLMQFRRHWNTQQEQTLRRWESEAKERNKDAALRAAIASGNAYSFSDSELRKAAGKEWDATPQPQRGALIRKYANLGVPIPQLSAILDRASPINKHAFETATTLYSQLRALDPVYASRVASGDSAGVLEAHYRNTREIGLTFEQSVQTFGQGKRQAEEARQVVADAWKDKIKEYTETAAGHQRNPREILRIREEAERFAAMNAGVTGEDAIRAAVGRLDSQHTVVNNARVPNIGMPKGAEKATEVLLGSVAKKLELDVDDLRVVPNPRNPAQWQVVGKDGFPLTDPDTKRAIGFSPPMIASGHKRWEGDLAEYQARRKVEQRSAAEANSWDNTQRRARQQRTPVEQQPIPATLARPGLPAAAVEQQKPVWTAPDLGDLSKTLGTQQTPTNAPPVVPDDFLEYLTRK